MLPVALLRFLVSHGLHSLREWTTLAKVPTQAVYQARHGRTIAEKHVEALARVVGGQPAAVRALLTSTDRT